MRSPGSSFWMNKAGPCCGNRTFWIPLSAAISRLQQPVCWQTASMARTPSTMILRATSISSALTPRDAADNGLTMEKAQALGLNFCKENFPGHPAIVCTHPDGHNHSGNIHVHIVIGSIRTREVERKPYMQKPRDWREGMKHSSTAQTMRHLRVAVMEMCEHADLHQINLLEAQGDRISEREYWARRRWQQCLDHANARLLAEGKAPKQTKFDQTGTGNSAQANRLRC